MSGIAIYCRVSTNLQSVDMQVSACKEYCRQKGFVGAFIFKDEGISGAKKSRPALNEMLHRIRRGEIRTVITYSFSRIGRSTTHLLDILAELNNLNVSFISISEQFDTSTPIGKVVFTILSSLSQFERETLVSRVKAGLEAAKARGVVLGAPKKPINLELLTRFLVEGLSYNEIARLMGCSAATICRNVKSISKFHKEGNLNRFKDK